MRNQLRSVWLLAFVASLAVSRSTSAEAELSPAAMALIAPVHAAYAKVDAEQALLGPPKDDRERLERLFDLDQAARLAVIRIDLSVLPPDQRRAATDAMWSEITTHDLADQKALKEIVARDGWITRTKFGPKASHAAFAIVQHAVNDPGLMRTTLALLEPLAAKGQVDGNDYARMYDRVALEFDHRPQRYGTQLECRGGAWTPRALEDPEHVDERRRAVGLRSTEAQLIASRAGWACK